MRNCSTSAVNAKAKAEKEAAKTSVDLDALEERAFRSYVREKS